MKRVLFLLGLALAFLPGIAQEESQAQKDQVLIQEVLSGESRDVKTLQKFQSRDLGQVLPVSIPQLNYDVTTSIFNGANGINKKIAITYQQGNKNNVIINQTFAQGKAFSGIFQVGNRNHAASFQSGKEINFLLLNQKGDNNSLFVDQEADRSFLFLFQDGNKQECFIQDDIGMTAHIHQKGTSNKLFLPKSSAVQYQVSQEGKGLELQIKEGRGKKSDMRITQTGTKMRVKIINGGR